MSSSNDLTIALTSSESKDVHAKQDNRQQHMINNNISLQNRLTHTMKKLMVIWLDPNMNESNSDYQKCINQIKQTVSSTKVFTDAEQCIDFITDIEDAKFFLILPDAIVNAVMPLIYDTPQLNSVYVFCISNSEDQQWITEWQKIKGVFSDMSSICDQIQNEVQHSEQNGIPNYIVLTSSVVDLNELDQSVMYSQLLTEILLEMNYEKAARKEFVKLCREQFQDNKVQLSKIDNFEQNYEHHSALWWYINRSFIVSMVINALQMRSITAIINMGFYIKDLHQQIQQIDYARNKSKKRFTTYRGQQLTNAEIEKLKNSIGSLITFNSFLSTTTSCVEAVLYAQYGQADPQLKSIIFQMDIDPSVLDIPFVSLSEVNDIPFCETEVLFYMHTVYRINAIEQITDHLWSVDLVLTGVTDDQLQGLAQRLRKEIKGQNPLYRLGKLLIQMGEFDKAEKIFETLLETTSTVDLEQVVSFYNQLGCSCKEKGNFSSALSYHQKSLELGEKMVVSNDSLLASISNNIGEVYRLMGEYSTASLYYQKTLKISQESLPSDSPMLATIYNNICHVYNLMGDYSDAILYLEKTHKIQDKSFLIDHSHQAIKYHNRGKSHTSIGKYLTASSRLKEVSETQEKTIAIKDPDVAATYDNTGRIHYVLGEYSTALSHHQKALKILQKSLPPEHPLLATTNNNIGQVYYALGEYSTALAYYKIALAIQQASLPLNHPDLAATYSNIGRVYYSTGSYSIALSHLQKALEIHKKTLSSDHPDVAATYESIGRVHYMLGEYSTALSHYKIALAIQQASLPSSQYDLALTYNNIGDIRVRMVDYLNAISYYKKALRIQQVTFPPDHPLLANTYSNIGHVHKLRGRYSDALLSYEKALRIQQKALPANHSSLAETHLYTAMVLEGLHRYEEAVRHALCGLNIKRHSFEPKQSELEKYQKYIDEILLLPECYRLAEIKKIEEWVYPFLLVLQPSHQSRLHSILYELTDGHLMPPNLPHACLTELKSNEHYHIKSIVFEILTDSTDERDYVLKDFSSIDHIESIYLLGKPPKTSEERYKFFTKFCKVSMYCDDEEELAVRWALDTANDFRKLGGQSAETGNIGLAREYFQRGKELYNRLDKLIDQKRPIMS